jgi:DNA (cytosine-5)-methyltransferase 1
MPTLNAFDCGDVRTTILIIDGTRVGDVRVYEDDVMQTVIQRWGTGGGNVPAIYPIQGTVIGRSDTAGPQGKGFGEEDGPMYTLDSTSGHGVATESVVRRLTPVECERLQGFPDDWTDGQSDTHRYKQMGNAVTVNVVEWIGKRL